MSPVFQYFVNYPTPFLVDITNLTKTLTFGWAKKWCMRVHACIYIPACTRVIIVM